jgi:hypothetical protein
MGRRNESLIFKKRSFFLLFGDEKMLKNGDIILAGDALLKVRYFQTVIIGF